MKRPGIDGSFLLCLLLNMALNLHWTIPAWILLACHFAFGISLWWFVGALGLWFAGMIIFCVILSVVSGEAATAPSRNTRPDAEKRAEIFEKSRAVANKDVLE